MGMQALLKAAAKTTLSVAGDIPVSCTYTQVVDDGINALSTTSFTIDVLLSDFLRSERMADDNIQPGDVAGVVLFDDMSVKPVRGDKVEGGGKNYRVVDYSVDPAKATYELHLRTL